MGKSGGCCSKNMNERPRRRLEDNIKNDIKEVAWEGVDCVHLA